MHKSTTVQQTRPQSRSTYTLLAGLLISLLALFLVPNAAHAQQIAPGWVLGEQKSARFLVASAAPIRPENK